MVACDGGVVAYDRTGLRVAYDKYGDYAVATLLAKAWADAAQRQGLVRAARAPHERAGECLAGAWASAIVDGTLSTTDTLSPGDLDEAVSALLKYPGPNTPGNSAFTRFKAFRAGCEQGAPSRPRGARTGSCGAVARWDLRPWCGLGGVGRRFREAEPPTTPRGEQ